MLKIVPHIGHVKYITLFISASWELGKRNELSEFDDGSDHLQTSALVGYFPVWSGQEETVMNRNRGHGQPRLTDHYWFGLADRQHVFSLLKRYFR